MSKNHRTFAPGLQKDNYNEHQKYYTAVIGLLVSVSCSGGAKQEKDMNNDGKTIVVFFSHAGDNYAVGNIEVGNTKIVADYITELK